MFRAFNMGIGLIAACAAPDADRLLAGLAAAGDARAKRIGRVGEGTGVRYVGTGVDR
jgi:phosphoribosylaminoimidazole (AIR) synthetase